MLRHVKSQPPPGLAGAIHSAENDAGAVPTATKAPVMAHPLLADKLSKIIGYSGHLPGVEDAIASISQGASYVEKHFTINKKLPGRDNKFALMPEELKKISDFRDAFQKMIKFHGLDLQKQEMDIYKNYRGRWSKN